MRLLKATLDGINLFKDGRFDIDLFASDRVVDDQSVTELEKPVYSQNLIGFAGINASGKTSALRIVALILDIVAGKPISSHFGTESLFYNQSLSLRALFKHEESYYLLHSDFGYTLNDDGTFAESGVVASFADEALWRFDGRIATKQALGELTAFIEQAHLIHRRSTLSREAASFLSNDISIASSITKNSKQVISPLEPHDRSSETLTIFETRIAQAFDSSIQRIAWNKEQPVRYELAFKNGTGIHSSNLGAISDALSSGTITGSNIVAQALGVLRTGGYLLLDEIENHLNKQLVGVVFDLFSSRETNPLGAVLLFTTHYPEILDFIRRKDNIYFLVRDRNYHTEMIRYSDRMKRIENKKSEVFLSNYIKGTAPNYSEIAQLKKYVKQAIAGDGND